MRRPEHKRPTLRGCGGPTLEDPMSFRAIKGMNDLLPADLARWQRLEATFRRLAALAGYDEVRTPILEETELFVRSIGEATDVVEKEMYTLARGRQSLTMRPEGTASAARAYVEHKVFVAEPLTRWFYLGPMFRAENVQRGRLRQFHQAGCELYGDRGPSGETELIELLVTFFRELGVPDVEVTVNSIGGAESKARYRQALVDALRPELGSLSEVSRRRFETNPLRILDSKEPEDRAALARAPSVLGLLDDEDRAHWEEFRRQLDALGIPYRVDERLVRGLDYYTRTLFELRSTAGELGAQNTLAGGGRYDTMIESLGGPSIPAIGFALGLERTLLAMPDVSPTPAPLCALVPVGAAAAREAQRLGRLLRGLGVRTDLDLRGTSLKSMLRRANAIGAGVALVLGDNELAEGVVQLKDLTGHRQENVPLADVGAAVLALLGAPAAPSSTPNRPTASREHPSD